MHYKLLENYRGFREDRQSVFCDLTQKIELSFSLPENLDIEGCELVATFTDAAGKQCQEYIRNAAVRLPEHFMKPQAVGLTVTLCQENQALRCWRCEPVRIASFADVCKNTFELSPELTDIPAEITALNEVAAEQAGAILQLEAKAEAQAATISQMQTSMATLAETLQALVRQIELIENRYNIIETIKE